MSGTTTCVIVGCEVPLPLTTRYTPIDSAGEMYRVTHEVDQDALRAHLLNDHRPTEVSNALVRELRRDAVL